MSKKIESHLSENRVFRPSREFSKNARVSSMAQYRRMYKESIEKPASFRASDSKEPVSYTHLTQTTTHYV